MPRREMTKKLIEIRHLLKEAYENGCTVRELSHVYETSIGTIRARLKEAGVDLRRVGRRKKE